MKKWFKKNALYLIGATVDALAGYPDSYRDWQQVGCASGSCMITSKPINSTLYCAVMGSLLFGMFKKEIKKEEKPNHDI
jgi:hypothetical protein